MVPHRGVGTVVVAGAALGRSAGTGGVAAELGATATLGATDGA